MRRSRCLSALLCLTAGLLVSRGAAASVLWNWTFGTESGTFRTDGTFADTAGSHTFTITDFHVSASGTPANVGAVYAVVQPTAGMVWNGSTPTEFFRDSGGLTNGADFKTAVNSFQYTLIPGTSLLVDQFELLVTTGDLTVTPTAPVPVAASVPTLGAAGMALLALSLAAAGAAALQWAR